MNRLVYQILIFSGISALSLATSSVVNTAITAQAQQKDSGNKTTLRQSISPTIPKTLTQQELNEQSVMAIDWVQQSGEYRALTYQAFNCAKLAFDNAIAKGIKNPAAIVDIDETILDK